MSCVETIVITVTLTTCLILNSIGAPIHVTAVNGSPSPNPPQLINFLTIEESIAHKENETVKLNCSAKSIKSVNWRWRRNGKDIPPGDDHSYSSDNTNRSNQRSQLKVPPTMDFERNYTCVAYNKFGESMPHTFRLHRERVKIPKDRTEEMIGLSVMLGIMLVVMGILVIYFRLKPSEPPKKLDQEQIDIFWNGSEEPSEAGDGIELVDVNVNVTNLPYDRNKEITMKSLIFGRALGGGQFGDVAAVIVVNWPEEDVHKHGAAKSIRKDRSLKPEQFEWAFLDFIHKEIKITQLVGSFRPHENVVGYIGSVVEDLANYKAYLIVEYCSGGDLASLLRKHREQETFHDDINEPGQGEQEGRAALKTSHLIKWAEQIAAGLEHLASLNIPHMDLAIRNILLAHEDQELNTEQYLNPDPAYLMAKISDLGMARELNNGATCYTCVNLNEPKRRSLPFRWMAVEALETFRCTLESDIWSLGVTYWEMFTLGGYPYPDLQIGPGVPEELLGQYERLRLIEYFRSGRTLPEPPLMPPQIWEITRECWNLTPEVRPSPRLIKEELHQLNEDIREQLQNRSTDASSSSSGNPMVTYVQVYSIKEEDEPHRYVNTEDV